MNKNYNIIKNNKVLFNVLAARSIVDGMGTRLVNDEGEVVYHNQNSDAVVVKGDVIAVGTIIGE